jgi:hypothetical protein
MLNSKIFAKGASVALATALALGTGFAAHAQPDQVGQAAYRHFRAGPGGTFVPANGAEILGGFAGPGDLINTVTGETIHR